MAGHNKWSKIKNKKAVTDAKKAQVFSKIVRLISVEARRAQGNVDSPGLKLAIQKAREANMPNDNIERAIKKAASADSADLESIVYESYGPGGCAIVINTLTDNRNKTAAEVKHILSKNGFQLARIGSALWAFTKTDEGLVPNTTVPLSDEDADTLSKLVDDLEKNEAVQDVITNAE